MIIETLNLYITATLASKAPLHMTNPHFIAGYQAGQQQADDKPLTDEDIVESIKVLQGEEDEASLWYGIGSLIGLIVGKESRA